MIKIRIFMAMLWATSIGMITSLALFIKGMTMGLTPYSVYDSFGQLVAWGKNRNEADHLSIVSISFVGAFFLMGLVFGIMTLVFSKDIKHNRDLAKTIGIIGIIFSVVFVNLILTMIWIIIDIYKTVSSRKNTSKSKNSNLIVSRSRRFLEGFINLITLNFLMIGNLVLMLVKDTTLGGLAMGYKYDKKGIVALARVWGGLSVASGLAFMTLGIFTIVDFCLMGIHNGWIWEMLLDVKKENIKKK